MTETLGELARMAGPRTTLAPADFDAICVSLGLRSVPQSRHMFGGDCPICRGHLCFFVWLDSRPIRVVCYECGLDLSVHRNKARRKNGSPGKVEA